MNENYPPFCRIKDACRYTGLSQFFIRKGCIEGRIPCLMSGRTYFVNMKELFKLLDAESRGGGVNNGNQADVQQCGD